MQNSWISCLRPHVESPYSGASFITYRVGFVYPVSARFVEPRDHSSTIMGECICTSEVYSCTHYPRGSSNTSDEESGRRPHTHLFSLSSNGPLGSCIPSSSKLSTSSFTSKFAAHFSSSKSDLPLDPRASSSRASLISSPSSSGLAPPRARPSNESGSSTSRNRSTTPRGARPGVNNGLYG